MAKTNDPMKAITSLILDLISASMDAAEHNYSRSYGEKVGKLQHKLTAKVKEAINAS